MSMDCPKMVADIELNDIYFNLGSLTKGLKKLLNIDELMIKRFCC